MKKQTKTADVSLEKALVWPGLALVVLGCVASIYYTYINQRFFLQDNTPTVMSIYYLNYLVVLGGGFTAGYLLTKKSKSRDFSRLFSGVVYALLTTVFFFLWSAVNFLIRIFFGELSYPWGMYSFGSGPLFALLITVVIAFCLQYRDKQGALSIKAKWIFVISFLLYELYNIGQQIYYVTTTPSGTEIVVKPLWLAIGSYLVHPLALTIIAFLVLWNIKDLFRRLFYSTFIGSFSLILMLVLWNFQTDASMGTFDKFQIFSVIAVICISGFLIWRARSAAK